MAGPKSIFDRFIGQDLELVSFEFNYITEFLGLYPGFQSITFSFDRFRTETKDFLGSDLVLLDLNKFLLTFFGYSKVFNRLRPVLIELKLEPIDFLDLDVVLLDLNSVLITFFLVIAKFSIDCVQF